MTITPKSWALQQRAKKNNVSKSTIRKTRPLEEQNALIEMPDQVCGKKLKEGVKLLFKEFCNSVAYSKHLPGARDCVSLGKKLHVSKRLTLHFRKTF